MPNHLNEAIDFAITNGLLKYNARYELTHAPFSMTPCLINPDLHQKLCGLTPHFNALWLKIANDTDFLREALHKTAQSDEFIRNLLDLLQVDRQASSRQLLISRNDFLLTEGSGTSAELKPKQVEFNTISNSFISLSRQVSQLHHHLFQAGLLPSPIVINDPLEPTVDMMARVINDYGHRNSCLLMIVQAQEQNIFDQRAIEYRLLEKHAIPTVRMTLEEVHEQGKLRDGHLVVSGNVAALTYFRAAYTPADYTGTATWKAREMIEASSSVKCPSVGMQLAGAKKIQQLLADHSILQKFVDGSVQDQVQDTFTGLYALDDLIEGAPATEIAIRHPARFVLKPQREGGGNNLYDDELKEKLTHMGDEERDAYILMERIMAVTSPASLVVEANCEELSAVSEIGRFGICLAEGDQLLENRDAGYLVRTKSADMNEGGVCAGYACLNSLSLTS